MSQVALLFCMALCVADLPLTSMPLVSLFFLWNQVKCSETLKPSALGLQQLVAETPRACSLSELKEIWYRASVWWEGRIKGNLYNLVWKNFAHLGFLLSVLYCLKYKKCIHTLNTLISFHKIKNSIQCFSCSLLLPVSSDCRSYF